MPSISIIICTRNRATALATTLAALGALSVPAGCEVEVVVADNGSTDETAEVLASARFAELQLQSLFVPEKGKSFALNAAIAAARGELLLFTDDDVVPVPDWMEKLTQPLRDGAADAVGGRIELAPELQRPWLTPNLASWLAVTDTSLPEFELVGANMGLRRTVLERVVFDGALAPGAIGLGEDTLLTWQLHDAGFRILFVPDAVVVHHPEASRLRRASWLKMAESHGRKDAYLRYHWLHDDIRAPRLRRLVLRGKLALRRLLQPPVALEAESCEPWEMSYVGDIAMCTQFCAEKKRARRYPGPRRGSEKANAGE